MIIVHSNVNVDVLSAVRIEKILKITISEIYCEIFQAYRLFILKEKQG